MQTKRSLFIVIDGKRYIVWLEEDAKHIVEELERQILLRANTFCRKEKT